MIQMGSLVDFHSAHFVADWYEQTRMQLAALPSGFQLVCSASFAATRSSAPATPHFPSS